MEVVRRRRLTVLSPSVDNARGRQDCFLEAHREGRSGMETEWLAVLPRLRQQVGERNFTTWIEPIQDPVSGGEYHRLELFAAVVSP